MEYDQRQPIFVAPHAGKNLDFLSVTHKMTGQQTGGTYYLFELETASHYLFLAIPAGLDK